MQLEIAVFVFDTKKAACGIRIKHSADGGIVRGVADEGYVVRRVAFAQGVPELDDGLQLSPDMSDADEVCWDPVFPVGFALLRGNPKILSDELEPGTVRRVVRAVAALQLDGVHLNDSARTEGKYVPPQSESDRPNFA